MKKYVLLRIAALLVCTVPAAPGSAATASPPPAAEVFGSLPAVQHVAISPNGQLLATDRSTDSGTLIEIYDIGATSVRRTINLEQQHKLRDLNWANDEVLLVDVSFAQTMGGFVDGTRTHEFERTLSVNIDRGAVRTLLLNDLQHELVTGSTLHVTRTGRPRVVAMSSWNHSFSQMTGARDTRLRDDRRDSGWALTLFDVSTYTGQGKVTAVGTPYTRDFVVNTSGEAVARGDWDAERDVYTVFAKVEGGWQDVHRTTDGELLQLGGLTPDGKSVLAAGMNGSGRSRVWAIALDGSGAKVYFEDPEFDVEALEMDVATGEAIGAYVGGMQTRLHYFDPKLQTRQKSLAKAFQGRRVSMIDRSADGTRVIVEVDSPSNPTTFYLVDFGSGKADIAGEEYPALNGVTLGEVREIHYAARDGASIPAYLTLPPGGGDKNLPMVVLPHGGPTSRDFLVFNWWPQFLASRGYAVLQPQFRGSSGFGAAHREAGYRQWGGLMQDDVTDGVRETIRTGLADPERICIAGASYGGYAALAGAAFTPDLYACAVSVNGVTDLPAMIGYVSRQTGSESDYSAEFKDHIGSIHDSNLAGRSPARAAESVRIPILLLHGADDTVVPIAQSETMERALMAAGKTCTFVKLPGEDHWLSKSATRTQVLREMETFLARHLRAQD
jgi:dipeptidyl aminopeptidase/acylaminoacyl peptidase